MPASCFLWMNHESATDECFKDRKYRWVPVGATPVLIAPIAQSQRWPVLPVYNSEHGFMNWLLFKGSFDMILFNTLVIR